MSKQIFALVAPVCAFAWCGFMGEVLMDCNHQHLLCVRRACFCWDGESLLMEKNFSGREIELRSISTCPTTKKMGPCGVTAVQLVVFYLCLMTPGEETGQHNQRHVDGMAKPAQASSPRSDLRRDLTPTGISPTGIVSPVLLAFLSRLSRITSLCQHPPAPTQPYIVLHTPSWYPGCFSPPT